MTPRMIAHNVERLRKLLLDLRLPRRHTSGVDYSRTHYADDALACKEAFVSESVSGRQFALVWDLGCNDGRFSRIVGDGADRGCDGFRSASIDRLYGELRAERRTTFCPC